MLPLFIAAAAALVAIGAGCGAGEDAVAVVDGTKITREELEETVEHFEEESRRENRSFPEEGTPARRRVERRLLELLVDRAQLEAAARRLGVEVDDDAVERRLESAGSAEEEAEGEFARSTVRAQLVLEHVAQKLGRGIRVSGAEVREHFDAHPDLYAQTTFAQAAPAIRSEVLQMKRNRALRAWVDRARRVEAARTEIRADAEK